MTDHTKALADALADLLNDTQHSEHNCGDELCPVAHARAALDAYRAAPAQQAEPVGFNGLTEAETAQTMSVAGLSRPSLTVGEQPEDEKGLALWQLIYGAIAHEPLPLKVAQIEAAAKRVEDMLQRRAALAPAAQEEPVAWKWRNKKTGAVGAYFEDPRNFGIDMNHDDYEWSRLSEIPNPPAQGAGELTRFDAVHRALDLASLMAGSIVLKDRDQTEGYRTKLREHLFACIPAAQAPAAEPLTVVREWFMSRYGGRPGTVGRLSAELEFKDLEEALAAAKEQQ